MATKLNYDLDNPKDRLKVVEQILQENPNPSQKYLEVLADYLVFCMDKQERKEKKLLTENRLATINKRESSLEGLVSKFSNGEDGLYNIQHNDKHVIFQPKISITEQDLQDIPELRDQKKVIAFWDHLAKTSTGNNARIAKRAKIEACRDQYVIKNACKPPVQSMHLVRSEHHIKMDEEVTFDANGYPVGHGISLLRPEINSIILCNYSKLREGAFGDFFSDTWYLMEEFDMVSRKALANHPMLYRIAELKIDGVSNKEIQEILEEEFGIRHSLEYISSLWRKKIPNLIASQAEDEYLDWYYLNEEKGTYKRCSKCGQIKLAHNKYFSKNKTSKDGWYSICKECRNSRSKSDETD